VEDRVGDREATHERAAIAELRRCAGSQFDPAVVERLIEALMVDHEPGAWSAAPGAQVILAPSSELASSASAEIA
jgi:HD-GYP domain-containing protein (c-di-GMP phosphodiesterase class II)